MAVAPVSVVKRKMADPFFCKFLSRRVLVTDCVDDYVNANSLNIRHSPCFKCPQGLKTRIEFAST